MRIAVISHALITPPNRERWRKLAELYPEVQVSIFLPSPWEYATFGNLHAVLTPYEKKDNYEIVPVEPTHKSNWSWYWLKGLGPLLKERKPHFIFVMQEEFTLCLHWTILIRKFWAPQAKLLFFSWQNIAIANKKIHKQIMWKLLCRETDGMLAGTHQIKEIFEKEGYPKPIYAQTEIGVSSKHFYPDAEQRANLRKQFNIADHFVIGFCGRLVTEKGVLDLLEACFKLNGNWKLLIVGDGPLREDINKIFLEKGMPDRLILRGEVPASETPLYFRMMDCLVLPSRTIPLWREQFGLVLAQAMLTKVPAIGSDSGAIPEVIGDQRFIFPEGNIDELNKRIQDLMDKRLINFNFEKANEYTVDELAHQTYRIIQANKPT